MDRPDADEAVLLRTVRQFRMINLLFSRSRAVLNRYLVRPEANRNRPRVTVLDIGAGGCDIAAWLARRLKSQGKRVEVICLDSDPRIARMARRRYRNLRELTIVTGTIEDLPPDFRVDYAFSNHTLHHMPDDYITTLLAWLCTHVRRGFLMNDLLRSRVSHLMFSLAAGLLFHDTFSYTDGRRSIRRGFRPHELRSLAERALRNGSDRIRGGINGGTTAANGAAQARADNNGTGRSPGSFRIQVKQLVPGRVVLLGSRLPARQAPPRE